MDSLLKDPMLIGVAVVLVIAGIVYLILENKHLFASNSSSTVSSYDSDMENLENPLAEILYLYDHESEKKWLEWIVKQDEETQAEALRRIVEHLQGPSKHWGYITLEVLGVLHGFKDKGIEENLGAFFKEVGKLWGEYKSLPNYYERAAAALAEINPQYALKIFGEEFDRHASAQTTEERQKIIIDTLPLVENLGIGMLISILKDNEESQAIKTHAFNTARKLDNDDFRRIVLEALKHQVSRFNSQGRDIKAADLQLVQDLLREAIRYIGQTNFFKVIKNACEINKLREEVIISLVRRLKDETISINAMEAYAMTLLQDNAQGDLRKALASLHDLDDAEVLNVCTAATAKSISETDLKRNELKFEKLPIAEPFRNQYENLKDLFFQPQSNSGGLIAVCEKSYGGILLTGNNEQEKLYFSKAFAQEKNHNFGYIDLSHVVDKETYNSVVAVFSTLRKPYVLFIDNADLMYPTDNSMTSSYREKFSQTLYIQAMDAKSLLVGSIHKSFDEIQDDDSMQYSITKLKTKFFAQAMEFNKREEGKKPELIEDYLKYISTTRFENRTDIVHEMMELGKEKSFLEFAFFISSTFATMLMVYGKGVAYSEVKKLEDRFNSNNADEEYEAEIVSAAVIPSPKATEEQSSTTEAPTAEPEAPAAA